MNTFAKKKSEPHPADKRQTKRGIRRIVHTGWSKLLHTVLCVYYVLTGSETSSTDIIKICAAITYILLPHDILPDNIYLVGFTDDLAACIIIWQTVKANLTEATRERVVEKMTKWSC